jgi:SAM-dependent methyltransferase
MQASDQRPVVVGAWMLHFSAAGSRVGRRAARSAAAHDPCNRGRGAPSGTLPDRRTGEYQTAQNMKTQDGKARRSRSSGTRALLRATPARDGWDNGGTPVAWQLQMFDVSLKKQQELAMLLDLLGPLREQRCLLLTHGDNPGSLNYHLRAAGGRWSWAEMEAAAISQMEELLGESVQLAAAASLPFEDDAFDRVVVVDVHEHLADVGALNVEIARVLAPEGVAIVTTPSGDPQLPAARVKRWIGMDSLADGHVVQGYRTEELEAMMVAAGLAPVAQGAYSRFFTEITEIAVAFGYGKVLGRKRAALAEGEIAPRSADRRGSAGGVHRLYRMAFPLLRGFSALDLLVPGRNGYAVAVAAQKPPVVAAAAERAAGAGG